MVECVCARNVDSDKTASLGGGLLMDCCDMESNSALDFRRAEVFDINVRASYYASHEDPALIGATSAAV